MIACGQRSRYGRINQGRDRSDGPTGLVSAQADIHAVTGAAEDDREEQIVELMLASLIQVVATLNLHAGLANSLDAELSSAQNALKDVNQDNDVAAINSLAALINAVAAQRSAA